MALPAPSEGVGDWQRRGLDPSTIEDGHRMSSEENDNLVLLLHAVKIANETCVRFLLFR